MIGSNVRRQNRGWIAGAGLACLSASGIFVSGCSSTATVADAQKPTKVSPQVAGTKGSAAGKKSAKQVAKVDPPYKVRISDLPDEPEETLTAQASQKKAPPKAAETAAPATNRRPPAAEVAAAQIADPSRAAQRRSPVATMSNAGSANSLAARPRTPSGTIAQTAASNRTVAGTKPSPATLAATRPVITPRQTETAPDDRAEVVASSHERRRADGLMKRAYQMYEAGYPEEALRLASVAAELESSEQVKYKRGEERPSEFIAYLQSSAGKNDLPSSLGAARQAVAQKPASSSDRYSQVAAAAAESTEKRRPSDPVRDLSKTSNNTPRFSGANKENSSLHASANAGRVEVPLPQNPRNADASIAAGENRGSILERARSRAGSESDVSAVPSEVPADRYLAEKLLAQTRAAALEASSESDSTGIDGDASADADAPVAEPVHTSYLTVASLIGLLAGVAGMFGLNWWRRKEQKHYAAAKDLGLKIQTAEVPQPQRVKRAA